MIADGRETELIPFMLRPFRCTDTRGRQAGPRQCVYTYVCMHVVGPQRVDTNDIPSYLWEEPSYRTFCLCVCVCEREREDIPPLVIKARPLGHPSTCSVDLKRFPYEIHIFQSVCISYYFCIS